MTKARSNIIQMYAICMESLNLCREFGLQKTLFIFSIIVYILMLIKTKATRLDDAGEINADVYLVFLCFSFRAEKIAKKICLKASVKLSVRLVFGK